MLTSIYCKKLVRETLVFGPGLNTILGPRSGANSIGKSSVLYLIDFVFGGDSFLKNCVDVINQKGHVKVYANFEFNNVCYRFFRSTEFPNIVQYCVGNEEKTIAEYRDFLSEQYGLTESAPTFRNITSRFSRIWRKGNEDPDNPLHNHPSESYAEIKEFLIKTFGYADLFDEMHKNKKEQESLRSSLDSAIKKGLISKATKKEVRALMSELITINEKINYIKDDFGSFISGIESIVNEKNIELIKDKNSFQKQRSVLNGKIERLKTNLLHAGTIKGKYFEKLIDFLPTVNIDKLTQVESFHSGITKILTSKIKEEIKVLEFQVNDIDQSLINIDEQIKASAGKLDKPKELIDEVLSLTIRKKDIERIIHFTEMKNDIDESVKTLRAEIDERVDSVLMGVEKTINENISIVCSEIYQNSKIYPRLRLNKKSYVFEHYSDSGTGKSYSDLLIFDISFLRNTSLPILIEDSLIFKNIESKTNEAIIECLAQSRKQIFVAMDQLSLLSERTRIILRSSRFMRVSRKMPAFGELWNLKD
ncbi:DUF2326 domain-containing protein [Klebsiella pneumoniae]|uniref:DUF2326 domain-containing protein n=1 Tax=Klebsiella pneumoniae TaxID=573 RepID=UPI000A26F387|nr:DUF2326 domain-containing protein [Klebsiella pneumoniae]MCP5798541.1 DUF2326 domain-containing protein [Klebsiella pneumoniae]MDZ0764407.1 DUF2326 domain-containing protein [Klebsiella pneumoniae]HEN3855067.1 DUF2326 domain-containing protein [Klebsiella pneumoniae]